jgi:hypothetical protein
VISEKVRLSGPPCCNFVVNIIELNMSTEEKKESNEGAEENRTNTEKNGENDSNVQPMKEEKPERNNSKRTGMPFGFDQLFFKFDHHHVE